MGESSDFSFQIVDSASEVVEVSAFSFECIELSSECIDESVLFACVAVAGCAKFTAMIEDSMVLVFDVVAYSACVAKSTFKISEFVCKLAIFVSFGTKLTLESSDLCLESVCSTFEVVVKVSDVAVKSSKILN